LPQLFNVLRGSMSLVGPRPHLTHEVSQMPQEAQRQSRVPPGLTGLWQVSGRSDLEEEDAIRLDLRYVENWSLTYDLQILWKTAWAVLAWRELSRILCRIQQTRLLSNLVIERPVEESMAIDVRLR
jgi:lipopolysaccharide/colanic/teichoic acid biosynthesis glycosyltransferase